MKAVFRYNSTLHELAELLIIHLTTLDNQQSKPHSPWRQRSAAHKSFKTIESPQVYIYNMTNGNEVEKQMIQL